MILGIDTSAYTTSMTVLDAQGEILFNCSRLLKVKAGERGLRQSDGFFQHVNQLTEIFKEMRETVSPSVLSAISVSRAPRTVEGSYMPVFHAGVLFARNLSVALDLPLFEGSHQEGHIMAAVKTSGLEKVPKRFVAIQLSGGTTELMDVWWTPCDFTIDRIGQTLDLNFGQLIDRIGVKLGYAFPAGGALDEISRTCDHKDKFRVKLNADLSFNISGLENKYMALLESETPAYIGKHLFNTVSDILIAWIQRMPKEVPVVLAGGVTANAHIREQVLSTFGTDKVYFAASEFAKDNALGAAELGRLRFLEAAHD